MNEGTLGKFRFGGERAHTLEHPPILRVASPADPDLDLKEGTIVELAFGKVAPWVAGEIIGVVDAPFDPETDEAVIYLAHGTVKGRLLKTSSGTAPDALALAALEAAGIYPV